MIKHKSILSPINTQDRNLFYFKNNLQIRVNGKKVGQFFIVLLIAFVLFHRFFIQCGLPDATKYLLDLITVILISITFARRIHVNNALKFQGILLLIMVVIGTMAGISSIGGWKITAIDYILDLRSILRPFLFIMVCYNFLDKYLVEKIKSLLVVYNLINSVYIVYQYFTLEVEKYWMRGDNLNGFFGIETGGNIYVNVVLVFTSIIAIDRYKEKQYNLKFTIFLLLLNIIIATLIELKMFYIEILVIAVVFFVEFKNLSLKKVSRFLIFIPIGVVFIRIITLFLYKIYPNMEGSLSLEGIMAYTAAGGYTGGHDLNRLSFIQGINNYIFCGDVIKNIIGQGIGSASVNTPFFSFYETTHYTWFSSAYLYIELGAVGLLLYITAIISLAKFSIPSKKKYMLCNVILTLIMILYNETMRTEACYLVAFSLASGLINNPLLERTLEKSTC